MNTPFNRIGLRWESVCPSALPYLSAKVMVGARRTKSQLKFPWWHYQHGIGALGGDHVIIETVNTNILFSNLIVIFTLYKVDFGLVLLIQELRSNLPHLYKSLELLSIPVVYAEQ